MIQSISRALDLLELLKRPQRTFSIAQLSSDIGLPPSTVHRLLQTLCEKGFVYRDEQTHLYQLGPALISLGTAAAQGQDLRQLATPVLQRLAQQALEDAFLIIPSGYRGLVLCQVDGPNNLRVTEKFGYEIDLHCGAIRKALLAGQPQSYWAEYIAHQAVSTTCPHPLENPSQLLEELKEIRREGVAITVGDYTDGAVGIGAPVFGPDGPAVASLGIVCPAARVENPERLKDLVRRAAAELSTSLGGSPRWL